MKLDEMRFEDEGVEYLKACFTITLYWTGSIFDDRDGFLSLYQQAWDLVGPEARLYQTDSMKRPKKVKADTQDLVPTWLKDRPGQREMYILLVDNREDVSAASDRGLLFHATEYKNAGALSLRLPVEEVERAPEAMVERVAEMAESIPFASGHAGYSVDYNPREKYRVMAREKIYALARRHPGLDVPCVENTCFVIHMGFKRVGWLTLLGDGLVKQLGGTENIPGQLSEAITIRELKKGLLLQAGPRPEFGDVNRRETLPLYREVGRAVAAARATEHPAVLYPPDSFVASAEQTNEWLAEFDD
jgi:hypothetical protein